MRGLRGRRVDDCVPGRGFGLAVVRNAEAIWVGGVARIGSRLTEHRRAANVLGMVRASKVAFMAFITVASLSVACRDSAPSSSVPEAVYPEVVQASFESPYVLQMSTEAPFDRISMKDVGMSIAPNEREAMYERVASSLSTALADDDELPMSSVVLYSQEKETPAGQLTCGHQQVYVDLWEPNGQQRWGYSLWSGCGEEDEFAHREVDRAHAKDVDTLTQSIAKALRHAVATQCFSREC